MATATETPIREDQTIVELNVRTDEMFVNMGPQHPSTHGVLRTDGEVVSEVTPPRWKNDKPGELPKSRRSPASGPPLTGTNAKSTTCPASGSPAIRT